MIEDFLKQVYKGWVEKVNSVHSIFTAYYGEDRVDLQMPYGEEVFVEEMKNWNIRNMLFLDEDELIELNIHFAKVIEAMNTLGHIPDMVIGNPEDLAAVNLTDEMVTSILQSIIDSDYSSYILNYGSFDFSSLKILLLFPEVTVTNENNKSEIIYDVYIKVPITIEGTLGGQFELCRSTFTTNQYKCGYMFSHTPHIRNIGIPDFRECCLGRGPIRETISNLMGTFDEDFWVLFCVELESYLRVESLAGGPYIRLETINSNSRNKKVENAFPASTTVSVPAKLINRNGVDSQNTRIYNMINGFIQYLIQNKVLTFSYINGGYTIGHSYVDARVIMSNAFINYVNTLNLEDYVQIPVLYSKKIIVKGIVKNNAIEISPEEAPNVTPNDNAFMPFTFKGARIPFVVKNIKSSIANNESIFLTNHVTHNILIHLLSYLNYGRNPNNSPSEGNHY